MRYSNFIKFGEINSQSDSPVWMSKKSNQNYDYGYFLMMSQEIWNKKEVVGGGEKISHLHPPTYQLSIKGFVCLFSLYFPPETGQSVEHIWLWTFVQSENAQSPFI